jgi:L-fucose isomerase-like protein
MHCASYGKVIPDFIDFTDLHPTEQAWLAWHCGNAAGCLCADGCEKTLQKNIQLIQWGEKCHGATWFRMKEGPVTAGRLVEYDGQFTFFFGSGEIVDIPPATTGTYGWVKVNDVMDWENKMAMNGIIHHGALIHDAAVADALELFCQYLGIRAVRGK